MLYKKIPSGRFLKKLSRCFFKTNKTTKPAFKNENKIHLLEVNDDENNLQSIKIKALDKNIKNLEFINHLEMNLQDKQLDNLPMEFFTDLKQLKQHSQRSILITLDSKSDKK
ncbi:hypothetical protein ACFSSB_10700 [Lacinutrix gracilariae]|uniref:Uncharacterized protein n=1 Tax=Lacinutrix gracilariae TaxID=1747198 RepID=A0ABW5K554_9FLAO